MTLRENWENALQDFDDYLKLERNASANTRDSYARDVRKLAEYALSEGFKELPQDLQRKQLEAFVEQLVEAGISPKSQARIISGIKQFYQYLVYEDLITTDPSRHLTTPQLPKRLPQVLEVHEIEAMLQAIDHTSDEGIRNRAILEVLYGSGLRVSELVNLKLDQLFPDLGFLKIIGKGNKERLVPLGSDGFRYLKFYTNDVRTQMIREGKVKKDSASIVFLNRRGAQLTRVMIFTIIKRLAQAAGIKKKVSPHTFRHSFATHLLDGGADLRVIQAMLGHESITTTEVYTHLDMGRLKQVIQDFHPRSFPYFPDEAREE